MVNEYDQIINNENTQEAPGNEYDSIIQDQSKQEEFKLKESLRVASDADPSRHSQVYKIARENNLPTTAVDRNFDKVKKHYEQKEMDYKNLLKVTPGLSKWLANPDNAKIAKNEIKSLKQLDTATRYIAPNKREKRFTKELDKALESGYQGLKSSSAALLLAYGMGDKREVAEFLATTNKRTNELYDLAPSYVKEFRKITEREGEDVDKAADKVGDAIDLIRNGDPRKGELFKGLMDFTAGSIETVGEALDLFGVYLSNPRGTIYSSVESLANSAPSMAAGFVGAQAGAAAGSVIPGVGTAVGGAVGFGAGTFAGAVPTEMGAWINSELSQKGIDTTDPDQIMKAFEDKQFIDRVLGEAKRKGVTTAAVDGVFNLFAGKLLKGASGKSLGSRVSAGAKELATQTVGEGVSEGAGQYAATGKVSISESLMEAYTSLGTSVSDIAIGAKNYATDKLSKDPEVAIREIKDNADKAMEAIQDAQELENVGAAVKEALNTQNVPGAIKELIEATTDGEEVSQVFFQTDDFDSYWASKGISPQEKANEISEETGKAYNQAKVTGEAFAIPMGEYAETIGKSEDFEGLIEVTRTKEDGMSLREANEYMKELPGLMKQVAEDATSNIDLDYEQQVSQVKQNIKGQLMEAGFSQKDADIQAQLYEARIKKRAEVLGVSPLELFNKKEIEIKNVNANTVKADETFKSLMKKRKERQRNKELQETPIEKLPKELRVEAESIIDAQIDNMIREIENSQAGQRTITGLGTDLKVTATKSTFPSYYKSINARNKEDFKKIAQSKKGRRYNRLRDIAIERLINGYESNEDGMVMPDNEFRSIKGLPIINEVSGQVESDFELFQGDTEREYYQSAFHGSADTFESFDFDKINRTAMGWGVYFTTSKAEADMYRYASLKKRDGFLRAQAYSKIGPFNNIKSLSELGKLRSQQVFSLVEVLESGNEEQIVAFVNDQKEVIKELINASSNDLAKRGYEKALESLEAILKSDDRDVLRDGQIKQVDIKTETLTFLDLDKSINDQSDYIKDLAIANDIDVKGNGENFYKQLSEIKGSEKEASQYLARNGVYGAIASDTKSNYIVAYSPEAYEVLDKNEKVLFQSLDDKKKSPRGRIKIGNDKFTIELLSNADPSTFIHESGHLFLEEIRADFVEVKQNGAESDAAKLFLQDADTILEFLGVDSFEKIDIEHHEKWARAFESYLGEGKAPTSALQSAFNRFRTWIVSVYRNLRNLNVELTDDVREVMDRLLATEEEIQVAARETGARGLFEDARSVGMSEAMAQRYEQAWQNWRSQAELRMTSDLVNKWQKEDKKFLDKVRKEEREKVSEMVSEDPVYVMIDELQKGLEDDGTKIKLNKEEVVKLYGEDIIDKLPKGIFNQANSYSSDYVAGIFGFDNGRQMIDAMTDIPTKKEQIDQLTEKKLREKYWDKFLNKEDLEKRAIDAIHSDDRIELLMMDLQHLASNDITLLKDVIKKVTRRPPTKKQIKAQAQQTISEVKVSELKPYKYQRAEAKNAKLAGEALAKGDLQAAFDYKEKELLSHELYREARNAVEFMEKANKKFRKANDKDDKIAKSRDMDLVNAARSILVKYGLTKPTGNEDQNLSLIQEYDPDAYETVKALIDSVDIPPKKAKELSVAELSLIKDTFDSLWDLARQARLIEVDGEKVEISKATEEITETLEKFRKPQELAKYRKTITDEKKLFNDLLGVKALIRRYESWIDVVDSGNISGSIRKFLFTGISEGTDKFLIAKSKYIEQILKEAEAVKNYDMTKPIQSDELGFEFKNKGQLLGALLHTGNESNLKKLLIGYNWGELREDGTLNTDSWDSFIQRMWDEGVLKKEDYDFVQSLWDKMEEIKPDVQKAHKKLFGFYFNEITSNTIQTPFGEYRGGYAPAKVDPNEVTDIAQKDELEKFIKGHQSYTYPASGGKGFTKSREDNFNKPLSLDINLVPQHIEETLRFTYVKPAVVDAAKIIMRPEVKAVLNEIDPNLIEKMIKPALNRADKNAIQNRDPSDSALLKRSFSFLKSRASMQIMFANVVNTVEQFSGLGLSATRISPKKLALALNTYMTKSKEVAQMVSEKSEFMKARQDEQLFEMDREVRNIFDEKSNFQKVQDFATRHTYFMQSFTQNVVDNITWTASYNESIEKGLTEKQAIRKADSDVRTTQSSRRPLDVANIEANHWFGFFNMFQNFFLMMLNLNVSNFQMLVNEDIPIKNKYKKGLYLYTMGFFQVAVIGAALRKAAAGGLDEDDDGEYTDDLYDVFIGSQISLATAMLPIAGGAINAGINRFNDKAYDDRVNSSPAIGILTTAVAAPFEIIKTAQSGKSPKYAVRDSLSALGLMTGLPLYPASRPIGYVLDVNQGRKKPSGPIDYTRGLITGK